MLSYISIKGAHEHNLRGVDLTIPKGSLTVFSGVSGSGKSSMAFETLYAEGQRRYLTSLSSYARQFLDQMDRPAVESIDGLMPTVSIGQKGGSANPRSTVGTMTEVYDFLRVIYAGIGVMHCVHCGVPIGMQSRDRIVADILDRYDGEMVTFMAPLVRGQRGQSQDVLDDLRRQGYVRVRVDGEIRRLDEELNLDTRRRHDIDIVLDRVQIYPDAYSRVFEAVSRGISLGNGTILLNAGTGQDRVYSSKRACPECGRSYEEVSPQSFSFNSPAGYCPECSGLGETITIPVEKLVPNPELSLNQGALAVGGGVHTKYWSMVYRGAAEHLGFTLDTPWKDLTEEQVRGFLYGLGNTRVRMEYDSGRGRRRVVRQRFEGVVNLLLEKQRSSGSDTILWDLEKVAVMAKCGSCGGRRLRPESLAVKLHGLSISDLCAMPVERLLRLLLPDSFSNDERRIAGDAINEVYERLRFLDEVGLGYLSLDRTAPTLSGGEAQRIRLAGQLGRSLSGVLYILDEPSIGLHQRDNARLLRSLKRLRDQGNTVVVVEHDEDTIRSADFVADFGPGPGKRGGELVAAGSVEDLCSCERSITGRFLAGAETIPIPEHRREARPGLTIECATHNNLKGVTVEIPAGVLTCVTGVSGSGKSSLITDVLYRYLAKHFYDSKEELGAASAIRGVERFDKVIAIDQSPIGRIPRSNPATYTKVFDHIRKLYAELPEAKVRGYRPGHFSFNVPGGRCPACEGNGAKKLDMDFLSDVWVKCEVCGGKRFSSDTLEVRFKGKSIADVLAMDVEEAMEHFSSIPTIERALRTLYDVGLSYIELGQPSPTLSGGEAQRIKLSRELSKRSTGKTIYILDEPTTGLHFWDVRNLLSVLHRLVDEGNTVIVIEHNLDVIKTADFIIDMGPEGGERGGEIVAAGTPEEVADCAASFTGRELRKVLRRPEGFAAELPVSAGDADPGDGTEHLRAESPRGDAALPSEHPEGDRGFHTEVATASCDSQRRPEDGYDPARTIRIIGASAHNLKHIDVSIPKESLTVIAGPSGAGKTSLAFDTLFAEGQRRYVESLSSYARQFLGQVEKPKVEKVDGLCPAVAIEQKSIGKNARSTVGTITEIYDYLRVLFARIGKPHCPQCGDVIRTLSTDQIVELIVGSMTGRRVVLQAPIVLVGGQTYGDLFQTLRRSGYSRMRVDGMIYTMEEVPPLDSGTIHDLAVVVDRIEVDPSRRSRLAEAVDAAIRLSGGAVEAAQLDSGEVRRWSVHFSCDKCGASLPEITPHSFAFNDPRGACPDCEGIGTKKQIDVASIIPHAGKSLAGGAVTLWGPIDGMMAEMMECVGERHGFGLTTPIKGYSQSALRVLLYGDDRLYTLPNGLSFQYRGAVNTLEYCAKYSTSVSLRNELSGLLKDAPCPSCGGSRIHRQARSVLVRGRSLADIVGMSLSDCLEFFRSIDLSADETVVVGEVVEEIVHRLQYLVDVGLEYLTLGRSAAELSGGEAQRMRLGSQLGSQLTGVLYVLDEPTVGLHQRDSRRVLDAMTKLRDFGNTLVAVEHDSEVIQSADYVIDMGPVGGDRGGYVLASGTPEEVRMADRSVTAPYLRGEGAIPVPIDRRVQDGRWLSIRGARQHNLRNIDVRFPLSNLVCVTGVSGSGKSSLVRDTLYNYLARRIHHAQTQPGEHDDITGYEEIDKVILVDQEPIGQSPRSSPATYTGVFDVIRQVFAALPEAKMKGFSADKFSFNHREGRCEACGGYGYRRVQMHFLPDVWVLCDNCEGSRYCGEALTVKYKGKSIAECLAMTAAEALEHFEAIPKLKRMLKVMVEVGLGYLSLGQSGTTLSAGECQRIKLARELARPNTGKTLYILDEPTVGLHVSDVILLLRFIQRLVDKGNTVICIEHNMDVLKCADYIIDLGPEGGSAGGEVVAEGRPEEIAACPRSHTGRVLSHYLTSDPHKKRRELNRMADSILADRMRTCKGGDTDDGR